MSNIDEYLKNSKRDIFQWECVETTDGYGMGGVLVEQVVCIDGRSATITKEDDNEYEIDISLTHPIKYDNEDTYEIIETRSNRKSARNFAEKFIKQDLAKDIKISEQQLKEMKHALGLDYQKKPYRNRYHTNKNNENWNDLISKKLAIKTCENINDERGYFRLTKFGAEFAYNKPMSDIKYKEL